MTAAPKAKARSGVGRTLWRWLKRLVLLTLLGALATAALGAGAFFYFDRGLPSVEELKRYQPPQVTKVFCEDQPRVPCAEFFRERRTWVPIESLPKHVKDAFLAAEDADFYRHPGVDPWGMVRAALKALLPGHHVTGASTISQQACRNLLLTQERKLSRKIREWILTPRMEKAFTKDQILGFYLNTINFGHGRYGIEEASLYYFGKRARDLSLGEAAVLAGVLQAPERINPVTNIVRAKKRQLYVLTQLVRHGFVPEQAVAPEVAKPIVLGPRPPPRVGAYYAEEVRRTLVARYGDKVVLEGGLRVDIAMDTRLQAAADDAVRAGLEALDQRQGYRGPDGKLEPARFAALRPHIAAMLAEAGKRSPDEVLVADLLPLATSAPMPPEAEPADIDEAEPEPPPQAEEAFARKARVRALAEGARLTGYVSAVDDARKLATVDLVGKTATLPFASAAWARPRSKDGRVGAAPHKMSDVLAPGDLARVRVVRVANATIEVALDQVPVVQGALLVIEPQARKVRALVGGYDFERSSFDRAIQAHRQPGSSFKPFLYAAAIASQRYTSLTMVNDAPEAVRDPYTGKLWKPQNFEKGGFEGPMTLRQALTKSKNTVSVRLIEALTPQAAIELANKAGIRSDLPDNLTLALGTGEVTMLEIANAYATLQSLGRYAEPILVSRVTDARGTVLEEHHAALEEVLPPPVAYMATSLMRSVVEEGTAVAVKELNRPAAGKTGTAQEYRDAWFSGYTADFVASAWVGFDDHGPLGPGETGGRAALPIWLQFMKAAHENLPVRDFDAPEGVVFVRVDPVSGLLAGKSVPGRLEPFLDGTQPTTEAPAPGQVRPEDFFLHDAKGG